MSSTSVTTNRRTEPTLDNAVDADPALDRPIVVPSRPRGPFVAVGLVVGAFLLVAAGIAVHDRSAAEPTTGPVAQTAALSSTGDVDSGVSGRSPRHARELQESTAVASSAATSSGDRGDTHRPLRDQP